MTVYFCVFEYSSGALHYYDYSLAQASSASEAKESFWRWVEEKMCYPENVKLLTIVEDSEHFNSATLLTALLKEMELE